MSKKVQNPNESFQIEGQIKLPDEEFNLDEDVPSPKKQSLSAMNLTSKSGSNIKPKSNGRKSKSVFNIDLLKNSSSYTDLDSLFFLAENSTITNKRTGIPCIYLQWSGDKKNGTFMPYTILYTHDFREDLGSILSLLHILKETLHCNIIAYEFPGSGINSSSFTEQSCIDTIQIIYNFLLQGKQVPTDRIILMGKIVGASISISFTFNLFSELNINKKKTTREEKFPISALVLITPVAKIQVANMGDVFDIKKKVKKIICPTFLSHCIDNPDINHQEVQNISKNLENCGSFKK